MNISKTAPDRAISSEFLTRRVVGVSYAKGKNFNFRHFWQPSWILYKFQELLLFSRITVVTDLEKSEEVNIENIKSLLDTSTNSSCFVFFL